MFDNAEIKKILNLSDDDLKDKISIVMNAAGGGNAKISDSDIEKIRKAVSNLSEKDLANLISKIPTDKLKDIKNKLSDNQQ